MNPLRPIGRTVLGRLRRLHRRVLLHRRPLAALTAGAAVFAGLQALSPPPPETVPVWTAARDLPSGTMLHRSDLAETRLSPETVPAGSVSGPDDVLGRTLAAPMSRGEVLTGLRTVGPGLLRGYPGTTAVPLRITDAAVATMLEVGDRISLVAADPDGRTAPRLLLEDVPIVALPRVEQGALTGTPGRLVVAAVPSPSASEVAATAATAILIPVWTR